MVRQALNRAECDPMNSDRNERDNNLEGLHSELTQRIAILSMVSGSLLIWLNLIRWPLPIIEFGLGAALLGMGWGARALESRRPTLARHLLVWGLTVLLLAGMGSLSDPWLPFLALPLMLVSTMLVQGGGVITAGLVTALAIWLTRTETQVYSLTELIVALALGMVLAWLMVHTLYTTLQWTQTMQRRAGYLLEQTRDRQAELSRVLKSLELVNSLQRRTQHELAVACRQAEKARQMKEQFAANISHELRTPLNLILGFSEIMYLTPQVYGEMSWPPTLRRDVYQVYRNSRHLMEMINDILDLSRFEMTGFTLNKEPTPLESLLKETMEIAADLFRAHPAHLEMKIAPDLPTLEIDRTRIRQVLLNLFNNARRHTAADVVQLEARQVDGEVWISVSDTGQGIPADKLPYLFDEYYQVDYSLRRERDGTGLGLAISKRFVEVHGGRIWVESQPGAGTTFTFSLPILGHYVPALQADDQFPPGSARPESRPSILVVDRDPAVTDLVRCHLKDYEAIQVEEIDQLAEMAMTYHPRAVIFNVSPGEARLNHSLPSIPVPFIECSLPSCMWTADDLAVKACLTKPIASQQLMRAIGSLGGIRDILIVDDDRGFVQLIERILVANDDVFAIRRAYDGDDALQAMRDQRPDLVLLDLIMPRVDGFRVLEEMRCNLRLAEVPVILLTATSYEKDVLARRNGQIVIRRPEGLHAAEVLRCLEATINVMEPRYDSQALAESTPPTSVFRSLPPTSVRFG
jgi:signal transduction histidine kinase/CheY-like chemotaxis protein